MIDENLSDDLDEHTKIGIGGGLGQNSSLIAYLNQKVERGCFVTSTSCSDRGNSLGAMYSNFKTELDEICPSPTPFLGYDADLLELDKQKEFKRVSSKKEAVINAAKKLADNQLLCTFISRAEYGARALGNRSILANPSNPETRDVLNRQVKHRELYRPFAAIVLPEECPRYLLLNKSEPLWMTECIKVKNNLVKSCPSAVHIDETCRVQIAHKNSISPIVHNLLEITTKEHEIPAIINTSLNDAGEAIVNNLQDLVKTMKSTGSRFVLTVVGLYELKDIDN